MHGTKVFGFYSFKQIPSKICIYFTALFQKSLILFKNNHFDRGIYFFLTTYPQVSIARILLEVGKVRFVLFVFPTQLCPKRENTVAVRLWTTQKGMCLITDYYIWFI